MIVQNFDLEKIKTYSMFYILQKFSNEYENIDFIIKNPDEDIIFEDCELFRLDDGNILVCFNNNFNKYFTYYSIEAYSGDVKEIINFQLFEKIMGIYNAPPTNENGGFLFCKSVKIEGDSLAWRCEKSTYGPKAYAPNGEFRPPAFKDISDIIIYDSILSVNSIAHITYGWAKNDEETAEYTINNDPMPSSTRTLSEILKLIYEWSIVSQEPFNNTDNISTDAKVFLDLIDFDPSLVSNQVDMQIANFLSGSPNARRRPENIQENSPELLNFLKKKLCHFTLSHLLSLFPGSCLQEDYNNILSFDKDRLDFRQKDLIKQLQMNLEYFDNSNKDLVIEEMDKIQNPIIFSTKMRIDVLANQKEILDEL